MKRLIITTSSQTGQVRENNEDMILVRNKYVRDAVYETIIDTETCSHFVVALADGMGGHNAGEVASAEVLSSLHYFVGDLPDKLSEDRLSHAMMEWFRSVNVAINSKSKDQEDLQGMGTTLVAILYYGEKYYWLNCGDSRLYQYRDGLLRQITTDHSLSQLTGESKHSNILTNCVGAGCANSYLDMQEFTADVRAGDTLMLCSDGLSDMVEDHNLCKLLSLDCNATELSQAAIDAGGYDNVSVCLIKVKT